jgi:CDGSH-type Zn-finger protein
MSDKLVNKPLVRDMEPGTYWYCTCNGSENHPFCDGTHKAEGLHAPVKFEVEAPRKMALCRCGKTAKPPVCDGAHKTL